jgi:hypothetical protein
MTSSRLRAGVALALALLVVGLMLGWAAHLAHRNDAAAVSDCGPVSSEDQLALLWLARIRKDEGVPLTGISLGDCVSGARGGVTAFVEVGRSEEVQDFFTDGYHCDVTRSCAAGTDGAEFLVDLDFSSQDGWRLTVHPV